KYRLGNVFARYLFGPGRRTALLSAKVLSYDPRSQKYAKRLARYLSWIWRIRASKHEYFQPFRAGTLLTAIGVQVNRRFPNRLLEHLERSFEKFETDGLISLWQYAQERPDQNRRGWLNAWLDATILVEPPQIIFGSCPKSVISVRRRAASER